MENIDTSLWSDKCDYRDIEQCTNMNPENYNFIVMQLNIHSLLSNITELKLLLTKLERHNLPVDVLLLCETFLTKKTERLIHIPHYKHYSNSRTIYKGGGTSILIRDGIIHKRQKDLEMMLEKEVKSTCVEMTAKCGKKLY